MPKLRVQATFSEVSAMKSIDLLCINTLYAFASFPCQKSFQIYQVWKRIKKRAGKKISPKTKQSKLIYLKCSVNVLEFVLPGQEHM